MRGDKAINQAEAAALLGEHQAQGDMLVWTVYDHPHDFPAAFIARPHSTRERAPLPVHVEAEVLQDVRSLMAELGLYRLPRNPDDDPKILETWI